jgi:hypothetical protein
MLDSLESRILLASMTDFVAIVKASICEKPKENLLFLAPNE